MHAWAYICANLYTVAIYVIINLHATVIIDIHVSSNIAVQFTIGFQDNCADCADTNAVFFEYKHHNMNEWSPQWNTTNITSNSN